MFALILVCFFASVAATAQEKATNISPASQPGTGATVGNPAAGETVLTPTDSAARKGTAELRQPRADGDHGTDPSPPP